MQQPGLANYCDDRRPSIQEHLDLFIVLDGDTFLTSEAKGRDLRLAPFSSGGLLEEFKIFGIRTGPTAFHIMHAELIQPLSDAELIGQGEVDAFGLGAVTESGIVDFDLGYFHVNVRWTLGQENRKPHSGLRNGAFDSRKTRSATRLTFNTNRDNSRPIGTDHRS